MGQGESLYVETIFPIRRYGLQFSFVPGEAVFGSRSALASLSMLPAVQLWVVYEGWDIGVPLRRWRFGDGIDWDFSRFAVE